MSNLSNGIAPAARPAPQQPKPAPAPATREPDFGSDEWRPDGTKVIPMDNMRQAIAEHMVRSKHTSPHVYSVQEVDVTNIARWRARWKEKFKAQEGFNLSFTPFFLEAAVKGLQKFPQINASVDGKTIILKRHINLGCAVALGTSGLIVPVIKRAEEKNFVGLARALMDLATRARSKKLMPDDVMDGTFTVTNPGVFGTMIGTPIINQPQVAILCLGAIKKRPVVIDDAIAIRDICYLTLSYDHRIVDGALGGQYLAFVREYLENWDMDRTI
ncbi:MAG: 2-oxo acid dehydrogenase subunit E2 [Candidatus Dadabacteria bacterium]|nr:MAG: 2-oxo acid dehydrogenase subunit E2 [Candidatus Dadabacteria bacterium]